MPHRDPETGEFLSSGDHSGAMARADDVLILEGSKAVGDTTVGTVGSDAGNTPEILSSLEYQRDYRILAIEFQVKTRTVNTDVTTNNPTQPDAIRGFFQFSTSGTFKMFDGASSGGNKGTGVYFTEKFAGATPVVWEDETNGAGGVIEASHDERVRWLDAENLVDVDATPDAGTAANLHLEVTHDGGNADGLGLDWEVRIYVEERTEA